MAKRTLNMAEIEAQTALELPDREMMALVTIVITNLLNNNVVTIDIRNIDVAANICAVLIGTGNFDCDVVQA